MPQNVTIATFLYTFSEEEVKVWLLWKKKTVRVIRSYLPF